MPQNDDLLREYPDFIQPIYAARAEVFDPGLLLANDHITSEFLDFERVERAIEPAQRPLLHAAASAVRQSMA